MVNRVISTSEAYKPIARVLSNNSVTTIAISVNGIIHFKKGVKVFEKGWLFKSWIKPPKSKNLLIAVCKNNTTSNSTTMSTKRFLLCIFLSIKFVTKDYSQPLKLKKLWLLIFRNPVIWIPVVGHIEKNLVAFVKDILNSQSIFWIDRILKLRINLVISGVIKLLHSEIQVNSFQCDNFTVLHKTGMIHTVFGYKSCKSWYNSTIFFWLFFLNVTKKPF